MYRKILLVLLSVICVIGGVLSGYLYFRGDRQGPEIRFADGSIVYSEEDPSALLEGVTAVDDADGDVSASLIVEAIYPFEEGKKAKIVYAAMDSSNNVTKMQRVVVWEAREEPEDDVEEDDVAEDDAFLNAHIAILNGSGVSGLAGEWKNYMEKEGYTSVSTGNYLVGLRDTAIYTDNEEIARELLQYFPDASVETAMSENEADISLDQIEACVVVGPQHTQVP